MVDDHPSRVNPGASTRVDIAGMTNQARAEVARETTRRVNVHYPR